MGNHKTVNLPKQRHSHKIKSIASCVVLNVKRWAYVCISMKVSNINDLRRNSASFNGCFLTFGRRTCDFFRTWLGFIDLSSRGLNWKASDCIKVSYYLQMYDPSAGYWCTLDPEDWEILACGVRRIYEESKVKDAIVPEIHRKWPFNVVDHLGVDMPPQLNNHKIKAICFGVVLSVKIDPRVIDNHISMSVGNSNNLHGAYFTVTEFLTSIDGLDDSVDQLLVFYIDLSSRQRSTTKIHIDVPYEMTKTSYLSDVPYALGEEEAIFKKCVIRRIYKDNGVNPIVYSGLTFNLLLPGSRIPEWFNIQRMGACRSWLVLVLPPRWDADKIKAIACCVVFNVKLDHNLETSIKMKVSNSDDLRRDRLYVKANLTPVEESDGSDQTWLVYIDLPDERNWKPSDHLKISYDLVTISQSGKWVACEDGEIKVCGARTICDEEDDIIDNLQTIKKKQKRRPEECYTTTPSYHTSSNCCHQYISNHIALFGLVFIALVALRLLCHHTTRAI